MAKFDYTELANTAKSLVEEFGREMTFVQLDRDVAVAAQPHRGATDPRATPEKEVAGFAVVVPPSSASALGTSVVIQELLKGAGAIMIAALGPGATDDLLDFDEVVDGTKRWRITDGGQKLEPGDTTLLYFLPVAS